MDKIIRNYYNGYEGEPEIQFIRILQDGQKLLLRIWIGFFDNIMTAIKPDLNGWTGLAYYYHLVEGWYDKSPWEIPSIDKAVEQFEKIDISCFDENTMNVYADICKLLRDAQASNEKVWIAYE